MAIATANHVLMLEHSIYSVISPEVQRPSCGAIGAGQGCGDGDEDHRAGPETARGYRRDRQGADRWRASQSEEAIAAVGAALDEPLERFSEMSPRQLRTHRGDKFLSIGRVI